MAPNPKFPHNSSHAINLLPASLREQPPRTPLPPQSRSEGQFLSRPSLDRL